MSSVDPSTQDALVPDAYIASQVDQLDRRDYQHLDPRTQTHQAPQYQSLSTLACYGHNDRSRLDSMYDIYGSENEDTRLECQARSFNTISADRVYTIIAYLKLVFDGVPPSLPINLFLFRVESLNHSSLQEVSSYIMA